MKGTVSDVREQYANAFAVVVPLRVGDGTHLKSWRQSPPECRLISDTPDDFRSAVDLLITHPDLRLELIRNARTLVINNFYWAALGARLINMDKQLEKFTATGTKAH